MTTTPELTTDQVVGYLEATLALVDTELEALGEDSAWHFDPKEWCANQVVGHLIEAEKRGFATVFGSADAREGISAFLQKRSPRFEGK